jgi:hypothetical protein
MTDSETTSADIRMKGSGYYSLATTGAKICIDGATPLVLGALDAMNIPDDSSVFTMADMGCADGGTSIDMIGNALRHVRSRAPSRPLTMTYTDLPRNDFSQVFQIAHGLTDIPAYAPNIDNLYVFASGTSFHQRIFPAESLHFGFSATSSHYISERPGPITNHVHMVGADGAERAAYAEQGRADWMRILGNRAAELVSGGRLVLVNFCRDEKGRYLGGTNGVDMFDTFDRLWRALAEDGTMTMAEYEATAFPQYYRDVEECSAPLVDHSNPVYQAGLRLDHIETKVIDCPYRLDYEQHGDAAKFAKEYIPTLRSWSESVFFAGLSTDRPLDERAEIVDRFYDSYETFVRESPEGQGMDYVHTYMVIHKE